MSKKQVDILDKTIAVEFDSRLPERPDIDSFSKFSKKCVNALDLEKLEEFANDSFLEDIGKMQFELECLDFTIEPHLMPDFINSIRNLNGVADAKGFTSIGNFLKIDILEQRLKYIDILVSERENLAKNNEKSVARKYFNSLPVFHFIPELNRIREYLENVIISSPNSIEKAQGYLYRLALGAKADSNMEAAIYFASRSEFLLDTFKIRENWRKQLCHVIDYFCYGEVSKNIHEKAISKSLSFIELSELFKFDDNHLPISLNFLISKGLGSCFFDSYDESEFIDTTFIRSIEWFNISGFEQWVNYSINNFSEVLYNSDIFNAAFCFFYWCRSDYALKKTKTYILKSFLDRIMSPEKPWKHYAGENLNLIPIAGIIIFTALRIDSSNVDYPKINSASEFLLMNQLENGAWQYFSDQEPSILSTCIAIHALAIYKPTNWKTSVEKAKDWLLEQQNKDGSWYDCISTVMLTVLVLDSIHLAMGDENVTFRKIKDEEKENDLMPINRNINENQYSGLTSSFESINSEENIKQIRRGKKTVTPLFQQLLNRDKIKNVVENDPQILEQKLNSLVSICKDAFDPDKSNTEHAMIIDSLVEFDLLKIKTANLKGVCRSLCDFMNIEFTESYYEAIRNVYKNFGQKKGDIEFKFLGENYLKPDFKAKLIKKGILCVEKGELTN